MTELSPTDRVNLYCGKLIGRYERVIKNIWLRAMAMGLASPRRYVQLADEIRAISNKEFKRIYETKHPVKPKKRRKP